MGAEEHITARTNLLHSDSSHSDQPVFQGVFYCCAKVLIRLLQREEPSNLSPRPERLRVAFDLRLRAFLLAKVRRISDVENSSSAKTPAHFCRWNWEAIGD